MVAYDKPHNSVARAAYYVARSRFVEARDPLAKAALLAQRIVSPHARLEIIHPQTSGRKAKLYVGTVKGKLCERIGL